MFDLSRQTVLTGEALLFQISNNLASRMIFGKSSLPEVSAI